MGLLARLRSRSRVFVLGIAIAAAVAPVRPAWAVKNRTIVLRAAGSGAALGALAGLVSYPFAKSTGTIVAGAFVGALLGTVYGYHLVNRRDEMYRSASLDPGRVSLGDLYGMHAERDLVLRRGKPPGPEFSLPLSVIEF